MYVCNLPKPSVITAKWHNKAVAVCEYVAGNNWNISGAAKLSSIQNYNWSDGPTPTCTCTQNSNTDSVLPNYIRLF